MSFLAGDGEMARLTREHDWSDHPFGPPESWPQSLRSALGICLNSAFPTAIYWGPELRLLYNDAWSPIPGPRHPAALGAPAREVWADIWHVIAPQFDEILQTGAGLYVEDQMLPMRRFGFEEETYWNYSFTPIRGEDGAIAGIFNSGNETTAHVLERRRAELLLRLSDAFRQATDEGQILQIALRELGEWLGASRVALMARDDGDAAGRFVAEAQWVGDEGVPIDEAVDLASFGTDGARLMDGHVVRVEAGDGAPGDVLCGAQAAMVFPWKRGKLVEALLVIHSEQPQRWSDIHAATAEDVLTRMQTWAERQRALNREKVMSREIDHRARNLLSVVRSILRLTRAEDAESLRDKASDRILALSRTHSLLSRKRWSDVTLGELLEQELEPYGAAEAERIHLSGPRVPLNSERAQAVAMILHELVTNAAKHGALSARSGTLRVDWAHMDDGMVVIDWHERSDGPDEDAAPEGGGGFGSTLLPLVIEGQLGGTLDRDLRPEGMVCRITFRAYDPAAAGEPEGFAAR
ncbi:sensor histidine kinase [Pseudooceanicola sp. LIPI14-2-Ac024]|uniref:sensor histidine kinase n=1 Tax=Pseudooceanicola sp. LIPI14-2-Ac024 TaxID=3344875 RepID=UPI0035D0ECFD